MANSINKTENNVDTSHILEIKKGCVPDYYYLYDGKGNVMAVLDSSEAIVASYRYDEFGNLLKQSGTFEQPFKFSTKRYDEQTGLSYYGYRFYSPTIGRWMTRDPLGEAGGINLYGFVGNNAVNYYDPWGLRSLTDSEKGYLTPYIPQRDLDNADVHVGEMPWYAPEWAAGITRGNDIYIRNPNQTFDTPRGMGLLGHELVHVGQYTDGMTWLSYLWASRNGYNNNPYEIDAYKIGDKIKLELKKEHGDTLQCSK